MAVFSIVKLSELEGAKRLDAEYYEPVFNSLKTLYKFNIRKLSTISEIAYGTTPPGGMFEETGIPFVRSQNFIMGMVNKAEIVFCNSEFHERNKKSAIRPGDILFAAVGATIGQIAIVQDSINEGNINQNIARVRILDSSINPYYAGLFFLSKYGQLQIFRFVTGNAQAYLNSFQIGSFKIPVLSKQIQDRLCSCFKKVEDFVENSHSLYSQAENLLLEELGLKDFKPKYEKTYTAKLSDAFSAHRIDAEYFQPAYEEVIKLLMKKVKVERLKNVVSFISHGKQPYYVENGDIPVLIQKHLGSQLLSLYSEIVNMPDTPRTDREFVKKYPEYLIKPFDVLFYSVGAYLGRANVVLENFEAVPASFITLIRTKQEVCNPVYLALFLNSKIGQLQSSRWKSASAQQYIYPKEIKEFIIPILPLEIQQEIASLVQQSHEARKKAKELLELAKRAVEIAIEEGEEKAINFLSRIK
jgi:restriction endonuclease S subunit